MTKPLRKADREAALLARRVKDLHAVGLPAEVAVLATGQDVEVVRAGESRDDKKVNHDVARRLDAFDLISLTRAEKEAARRLERDMIKRRGENDRGPSLAIVDCSRDLCRQDLMLEASDKVTNALKRIGGRDAFLLTELIYPGIPGEQWRMTVLRVTKEINPVSQATVIRSACANLAAAYGEIDR